MGESTIRANIFVPPIHSADMTLRLGVVGIESFYGEAYADIARQFADVTVSSAATTYDDDRLAELSRLTTDGFADRHDCPVHGSVGPVLQDDTVDAVVVGTATTRRADDAVRAIRMEKPVLTAKPAADGLEGVRQIATAAAEVDVPVTTTAPHRFDDAVRGVKTRVEKGDLGEVHAIRADISHPRALPDGIENNPEYGPREAGSVYLMGYYTADALCWLADSELVRISGALENVNTPHMDHPDLGSATVLFDDGCVGTMTMTYSTDSRSRHGNWETEVVGSDGVARNRHEGYEGIAWTGTDLEETRTELFGRRQPPVLRRQFTSFVSHVQEGSVTDQRAPGPEEVVEAFELCDAWERAASRNAVVEL